MASAEVAADRIRALGELRPLVDKLAAPLSRRLLGDALRTLERELRADAAELRSLLAACATEPVRELLRAQLVAIEAVVSLDDTAAGDDERDAAPAPATAPPTSAPEGIALPSKLVTAPAAKPAAPTAKLAAASGGTPKPPPMDAPPGGFEPEQWPAAPTDALDAECWRSANEPIRQIPRCPYGSKAAKLLMEQKKPVVLTHAPLVASAAGKWDMDYLTANLRDLPCTVYSSRSRHFRYWDEEKNEAGYRLEEGERTARLTMSFADYVALAARPEPPPSASGDGGGASGASGARYYLQTALTAGVGDEMMRDFRAFDWDGLSATQRRLEWGELTSNLLLVGSRGNTTPAHYDEQQNLFAQLVGTKRCLLFSPAEFDKLYPFPVSHPCDRQSQVDLYDPDPTRFPRFARARPYATGDRTVGRPRATAPRSPGFSPGSRPLPLPRARRARFRARSRFRARRARFRARSRFRARPRFACSSPPPPRPVTRRHQIGGGAAAGRGALHPAVLVAPH